MTKEEYDELIDKANIKNKENLMHAVSLIGKNSNKTEFYYRLSGLIDKIRRYKIKFGEWDPDYVPKSKPRTPSDEPVKRMFFIVNWILNFIV